MIQEVFLKEFWDTVALQFFELVEEFLPKPPCRLLIHRLLQLACLAAPYPIGLRATTLLPPPQRICEEVFWQQSVACRALHG